MKLICDIYRSPKKEGMYLYVTKGEGLDKVPEALLERFGKPQHAMTLLLTPEKQLAQTTPEKVAEALEQNGFYLQMPPQEEDYMQAVHALNDKIPRA